MCVFVSSDKQNPILNVSSLIQLQIEQNTAETGAVEPVSVPVKMS